MTLKNYATTIAICLSLGTLAMSTTVFALARQIGETRTEGRIMCEEVAHAINEAYTDGMIEESHARGIIDRCFALIEN